MNLKEIFSQYKEYKKELTYLLDYMYNIDRLDIALLKDIEVDPIEIENLVEKIKSGLPLQYIVGRVEFMDCIIKLNSDVLIPRPETELLCEFIRKELKPKMKVLDLCTGSGAIIISLAKLNDIYAHASDISNKALELAINNAKDNEVDVKFIQSNLFDNIKGKFDLIVSNPPYIPTNDIEDLDSVVKCFEPRIALDGGADGLDFYREIISKAYHILSDGGKLFLEIGHNQGKDIENLLKDNKYIDIKVHRDFNGFDRIVYAKK